MELWSYGHPPVHAGAGVTPNQTFAACLFFFVACRISFVHLFGNLHLLHLAAVCQTVQYRPENIASISYFYPLPTHMYMYMYNTHQSQPEFMSC